MREATAKEFNAALAKAQWPSPRRMCGTRYADAYYSDRGTEVASVHTLYRHGKPFTTCYLVNPEYLED